MTFAFVTTSVIVKKWFANRLHHLTNNRFYILRGSECRFLWWSVFGVFAIRAYTSVCGGGWGSFATLETSPKICWLWAFLPVHANLVRLF